MSKFSKHCISYDQKEIVVKNLRNKYRKYHSTWLFNINGYDKDKVLICNINDYLMHIKQI